MLVNRPPIIVILGHVDHGKTSLLDYLRKSNLVAGEAGGITQHIRSFQLMTDDSQLMTFIDTPGHAAFSAMRERGSQLADLAILIVSGVDGVMPQTVESIKFIKSQSLPFLVAVTKADLPDFNADKVKSQLAEHQVFVEDMGGDVPTVSVSAKTGQGMPDLLEMLSLLHQLHPHQTDPQGQLQLVVLESRLDSQKGPLAAVVVTQGTLKIGQSLYQNTECGKVRALISSTGESLTQAGPSQPVEILGLTQVTKVGSIISDQPLTRPVLESVKPPISQSGIKIILKADVLGSQEAIIYSLPDGISLLSAGTGDVTENDILSASANRARIVTFNVRCPAGVAKLAEIEKVTIRSFRIIYELLDYLRHSLEPVVVETVTGRAQILAEFTYNSDHVAGCRVIEGRFNKTDSLKLLRDNSSIAQTRFKSLKTSKTDVLTVKNGGEFGAVFSPPIDFKVGDTIIAFTLGHV